MPSAGVWQEKNKSFIMILIKANKVVFEYISFETSLIFFKYHINYKFHMKTLVF